MLLPGGTGKPRAILGTMTFGPDEAAGARVTSLDDYSKCLDYLQGEGYMEIDTARVYVGGKQEAWSKEAHWQERGLSVATKCYPTGEYNHTPEVLRKSLETSLKELGTDCVDIFYLHAADRNVPFEVTLEECNKMFKEGKFVKLGLSNFTAFEVAEVCMIARQHGWVKPTIYQGMYNAITRNIATELIPACKRYGLDVVVYNPIAGGLFSGKYTAESLSETPDAGRFSDKAKSGAMYRKRYFRNSTFEAIAHVEPVVKQHGLTMLETALRWCVWHSELAVGGVDYSKNGQPEKKGNDGIIIGVSSVKQLEGNLKDLEKGPLPEEVVKALDEAWLIAKPESAPYWHLDLKYGYDPQKALFG